MATLLDHLSQGIHKPILFALWATCGALLGAILGEGLLLATRAAPTSTAYAVALAIDCSGSMAGPKLFEVQSAALQFVRRQDLSKNKIAVVTFGSQAHVRAELTSTLMPLEQALQTLVPGGSTRMDLGLQVAAGQLRRTSARHAILLFTDGMPDSQAAALRAAQSARGLGIRIVAVATDDADTDFLAHITGDRSLVFWASSGQFDEAFRRAERAIYSVVESSPTTGEYGFGYALLRIGGWTALLALGIGLALLIGQNHYLRRQLLTVQEGLKGTTGSVVAGIAAGVLGQLLFTGLATDSAFQAVGRIAAWAILGALLGRGMAFFVPNLDRRRALIGGGVGGALGAIGFLWAAWTLGDVAGRLIGTAILGGCIGLMIALVEAVFREAWLEIRYGPREVRMVSLGPEPVSIGADRACTVYAANAAPVAGRYKLVRGEILYEDVVAARTERVNPGDRRGIGNLTVSVQGSVPTPPLPVSTAPAATRELVLRLSSGRSFSLRPGVRLRAIDLPGLESPAVDGVCAEVIRNPQDLTVLGLKNSSHRSWVAIGAQGGRRSVEPGRSVRLAVGTKIDFGAVEGEVQ